jgi:hypothetical protein
MAEESPSVRNARGIFTGEKSRGAILYPNIAYAKPPVGKLRWRRTFLEDKARQLKKGVQCPQIFHDFIPGKQLPISEDCLYLNVWAPAESSGKKEKHPVIFFIHGGGLLAGSGIKEFYDGSVFARQDVVFVGFNYRLAELGYGPNLETNAGSLGLIDQGLALEWVVRNIEAFGGDPNRIFLMGHSKGAEAVTALAQSGLTGDEVKGGIAFSSPRHFQAGTQAEKLAFWPGEQSQDWEVILRKRAFRLYVPDLPSFKIPEETKQKFSLLASSIYDESAGKIQIEIFCGILNALEQFPSYIDAYFYIWHSPYQDHGGEVVSLFRQDDFGKEILRHVLAFVRTGAPPSPTFGRAMRPWSETKSLMHVYPWLSYNSAYELPAVPPGEINKFSVIRSLCQNKALPGSKINGGLYELEKVIRWWRGPQPDLIDAESLKGAQPLPPQQAGH